MGHTIAAIFDPSTGTEIGFISCFAEPEEAAKFLPTSEVVSRFDLLELGGKGQSHMSSKRSSRLS